MGRPIGAAWRPLGLDEDPTPGDPERVTDEVSHLNSVATTILNQISALQKIAGGGGDQLIGEYADKIRESASDLVGTLQTVHDRYTKVASALGGWESDLVTAQTMSLKALNEAEAPYQQLQLLNGPTISAPSTSPLTPQQQQEAAAHTAAVGRAQGQLNDAITDLHNAVQFRDNQASQWASKINTASDDSLRDSWWDSFKDFIGKWSWLIKDICTVLEVVGAVLAIIALFASGAWLLVAFIVTAAALLGRTLLAATGNGSWLDVIIDAVVLATLGLSGGLRGTGVLVARAAQTLDKAVEIGDEVVTDQRAASGLGRTMSFLGEKSDALRGVADFTGKFPLLGPLTRAATKSADLLNGTVKVGETLQDIVRPLPSAVVKGVKEESALQRAFMGGGDLADDAAKLTKLNSMRNLVNVPKFAAAASKVVPAINLPRGLILGGAGFSLGGVVVPGAPYYGPGSFGAEDPTGQVFPWHFGWFDSMEGALTAPIPEPAQGAPGAGTPHFTMVHGPIGK